MQLARRASLLVAFTLLTSAATGCLEQARSPANPYSFQILVGVWTWRPIPDWSAVLTIHRVSDTGLVTAEWKDPHWGVIPFKTQAQTAAGKIRVMFGGSTKYDLEYDPRGDALVGPVTNLPPKYSEGQGPAFKSAYFRRTK